MRAEKIRLRSRVTDGKRKGTVWELRHSIRASVVWDDAKHGTSRKDSGGQRAHVMLKNLKVLYRYDSQGRDVTDLPGLWSETDTERPLA